MFGSGDDGLVKSMYFKLGVLFVAVVVLLLLFNVVQLGNGQDHRFDTRVCTYQYKSVFAWSWVRINEPLLQPDCRYAR